MTMLLMMKKIYLNLSVLGLMVFFGTTASVLAQTNNTSQTNQTSNQTNTNQNQTNTTSLSGQTTPSGTDSSGGMHTSIWVWIFWGQ